VGSSIEVAATLRPGTPRVAAEGGAQVAADYGRNAIEIGLPLSDIGVPATSVPTFSTTTP
jgi:hypothetical protein